MRPSAFRRPSLCLSCIFSVPPRPERLLPRVQTACRSTKAKKSPPYFFDGSRPGFKRSFDSAVEKALERLEHEIGKGEFLASIGLTRDLFEQAWTTFTKYIRATVARGGIEMLGAPSRPPGLRGRRGVPTSVLELRLRHLFYAKVFSGRFTRAEVENQKELADLRHPAEWFPATRALSRTVHLHVGPTNSGKTYHALKRLEQAETGIYLGPLRLLAHEVYTRMNAIGKPCALVTGEEQRLPEDAQMWSCTVEMAPFNHRMDVAVIDEIQMINDSDRGWAWTQAVLGLQAREVHLCGEARTVPLIRELCALVGDKLVVHEYERLSPLRAMNRSLAGNLAKNLQKGDCVVSFSVLGIHALRRTIEEQTGKKCAIVYGSLPPETRAQQARLFNDPDNDYDFLVASNAIGMGLNLSIKRVIFESTMRNNGQGLVPLDVSEIKQIAGRAGRYRTAPQNSSQAQSQQSSLDGSTNPKPQQIARSENSTVGYATTLEAFDYKHFKNCMESEPEPISTGGLFPPAYIVERFANYFPPETPFSYILLRLHELAETHPRFHLCTLKDQLKIADAIHPIKNLTVQDRLSICAAPTNLRTDEEKLLLVAMAECIANGQSADLLRLPIPLEQLDKPPSYGKAYLSGLELLHKMIVLYLWLSYRFPHVFKARPLANHAKALVEDAIEKTLREFSYTEKARLQLRKMRQQAMEELEMPKHTEQPAASANMDLGSETKVPQEVVDVLQDSSSFESSDAVIDDMDEYPTPEIDTETNGEELETGSAGDGGHRMSRAA